MAIATLLVRSPGPICPELAGQRHVSTLLVVSINGIGGRDGAEALKLVGST